MEFTNFTFKDIKYKNGPETDPKLTMKYSAESMDDGTIKEARDKWDELPQPRFREVWSDLVEYWKMNLEEVLSHEDGINWDYQHVRIYQVKIEWNNGKPIMVSYLARVSTSFGETAKIPTPPMQPGVIEGEVEALNELSDEAINFLHGARAQQSMDFDSEDEVSSEDYEEEDKVELSFTPPNQG